MPAAIGPIQEELRKSDVIAGYGGEEFIVILEQRGRTRCADDRAAHPRRLGRNQIEGFGEPIRFTCSIGVAASDFYSSAPDEELVRSRLGGVRGEGSGQESGVRGDAGGGVAAGPSR